MTFGKRVILPALLCCWTCGAAQTIPERFQQMMRSLAESGQSDMGELTLLAGKSFLGTAYVAGTLDGAGEESLVVDFEGLDCFTFMEISLACARAFKAGERDYTAFREQLRLVRYREGAIAGYPSRLHYTVDWVFDNAASGIVRDITAELGGLPDERIIDFMSKHRDAYRALAEDRNFDAMRKVEAAINRRPRTYLPTAKVRAAETQMQDGDLIAITTSKPGLDVIHVGIANRLPGGRIHLLHASSSGNRVEVSAEPLAEYLVKRSSATGIVVFRPLDP